MPPTAHGRVGSSAAGRRLLHLDQDGANLVLLGGKFVLFLAVHGLPTLLFIRRLRSEGMEP
jgi:hypothetical protein